MKISDKKVGLIHYTLKNDNGEVLDTSAGKSPLPFIQGKKNLIPGMEKALEGKEAGEKISVVIPPEEAYGIRNEALVLDAPLENFPDKDQVKAGVQFQANTPEGVKIATVLKVEGENVKVDFNHPLADETLHFEVELLEVREATEDELSHGHVHGDGCNH